MSITIWTNYSGTIKYNFEFFPINILQKYNKLLQKIMILDILKLESIAQIDYCCVKTPLGHFYMVVIINHYRCLRLLSYCYYTLIYTLIAISNNYYNFQ